MQKVITFRDWSNYSKDTLVRILSETNFDLTIIPVQDLWNHIERNIISAIDYLAPEKTINISKKQQSPAIRTLALRKRKLVRGRRTEEKQRELKEIDFKIKECRKTQRKENVRKLIRPGDHRSLWMAVAKSQHIEPQQIPEDMERNGYKVNKEHRAEEFSREFKEKVDLIHQETSIINNIEQGRRKVNEVEKNFITQESVLRCMLSLKSKKCYGYDRIPLVVIKDGASILSEAVTVLLNKIYETKTFPEQWLISRIIPIHKKGNKKQIKNYRPISNLCSLTKVFERLLLERLVEIECNAKTDLTGENQHGFKKNRSTVSAGLSIQSKLAQYLDNDEYVVMASLDLSSAFDVVDHGLLFRRLAIMGIPNDVVNLLRGWLTGRLAYVEVNDDVSSIFEINIGVLQGSCLGPILYNLFVSPVFTIANLDSYADDSYNLEHDPVLQRAIEKSQSTLNNLIDWFSGSGLKVNKSKTEIVIFHRSTQKKANIIVKGETIVTRNSMNVLGVIFDSKLSWDEHVSKTIKESRKSLFAIQMIKKYFSEIELKILLTSLFYSKFYYASEVWHTPFLKESLKHKLMSSSSQALRKTINISKPCSFTQIISNIDVHVLSARAIPICFMHYKLCLLLFDTCNNNSLWRIGSC